MGFILLSLGCSFMMFVTAWLVLPLLVLFPLAIFFAMKGYKELVVSYPNANIALRLVMLTPIFIAIATIPLALMFISANYQA